MMSLDQDFFKYAVPEAKVRGKLENKHTFSIDSRTIEPGQIFIALKGKNTDGHNYLTQAIKNGASGIIVNLDESRKLDKTLEEIKPEIKNNLFIAQVPDTFNALLDLADAWRTQFDCQVVGITGSVGKTSTKEILSNILLASGTEFMASVSNQNTLLGAALNILRVRQEHKVAIFEMGISKAGEMERMAKFVKPTVAVITGIGHSHMEGLGSFEDIANEKRNIFKYFKSENIGIINGDQAILSNISFTHPVVRFGFKTVNQVEARKVQINSDAIYFILKLYNERLPITLATNHTGRINNSLAAAAVAYILGINSKHIVKGIEAPVKTSGRFEYLNLKNNKGVIINDAYNANPESMKAALLAFEKMESQGKKIVVLGDMLELGINGPFWHKQLGRFLHKLSSLDHIILVGELVSTIKSEKANSLDHNNIDISYAPNWQEATNILNSKIGNNSLVLVKGSHGMQLSNLVNEFI